MRKLSKISASLIAFIILISTFVMPANAASVNYTASSVSGAKGDTVSVSVTISSSVQIWGANVMLGYNSSELRYVSSSKGGAVSSGSLNNTGSSVNFSGMFSAKSGTVFTVKFKILKSSGSSTLTLTSTENIDSDAKAYACSTSNGKVSVTVPVTSVKLNKSSVSLKKGETSQLTATVEPTNATSKTVTYSTSNSKVATVSSSGKITAVGGGSATITAKAGSKTATCKVTVTVPQTGIAVSGSSAKTVELNKSLKLTAKKVPTDTTDNYSVTWSVADTKVATVSSTGTVKGVALGETTVTAKSNGWSVTYKITVTEPVTVSTTEEPSSEEPSSKVEEPSSEKPIAAEEPSSADVASDSSTEPVPAEPNITEPTTEKKGFIQSIIFEIYDKDNMVSKPYYYITMAVVAVAVALLASVVTYLVTSGYYKSKIKKNEENERY